MITLTPTQWNVFTFVQRYQQQQQCAPKLVDIVIGCGLDSKRQAHDLLIVLQRHKLIDLKVKRKRNGALVWSAKAVCCGSVGVAL